MIDNLKDLEKLLRLCRKQGVTKIMLPSVTLELGELPQEAGKASDQVQDDFDPVNPYANFPKGELTQEQLMFYSAGGRPEDDPENKDNA